MINSFGKTFKKLRTGQNITLQKATSNINGLSPSRLSHWENEGGNMPLEKLDQLLYNIHVLPTEFAEQTALRFSNPFALKFKQAFKANDIPKLRQLATQQLKVYEQTQDDADFFLSALGCNFYFLKTNKNLFSPSAKQKLTSILLKAKVWNNYYLTAFGNATNLLDTKTIYKISNRIIANFDQIKADGDTNHLFALGALLNTTTTLLLADPQLAKKLLEKINKLEIPSLDHYTGLYKKFLQHLINYRFTHREQDLKLATKAIDIANFIDRPDTADEFQNILSQVLRVSK
ncbi:Rgg/GadR/MutR family transcriptional regulator [Lactobacillus intestinalis]|nr:Rgg/GadR/MutR family transcriptional regulator [Lactobacillus intestinalis]UTW40680.1 XRE family transcriptional regulator [Lactobacillus intestinalis]